MSESNRPEWLKEKYNSIEDQAKAYVELEKKFGGFTGAPESYQIPDSINKDARFVKFLIEKGKELNLSQKAFENLVTEYHSQKQADRDAFKKSLDSLDPDKKQTVTEVVNYLKNTLGEEQTKKLTERMKSLDDIMVFDKLRQTKSGVTNPPRMLIPEESAPPSLEDFKSKIDFSRLEGPTADPLYREEIVRKLNFYTQGG